MTIFLTAILFGLGVSGVRAADALTEAFQKGLFEEEANQNLSGAIQAYESVLKQLDQQRKIAATTVFRLGECYRKLGKTNEATAQYQRIVREYPDQEMLAKLSQQNLTGLGLGGESKSKRPDLINVLLPDEETTEIERLKKVIKDSPDLINARSSEGTTPLEKAVRKGQLTVAKFLLENGADPNNGALPIAADSGHKALVELLLSHGADVNSVWDQKETALHKASSRNFRAVAEALIAAKADVNAKRIDGNTPLHSASLNFAELLLASGADPNVKNNNGQTPLLLALYNPPIVALLISKKADVNAKDNEGRTPLYFAIENRAEQTCEVLLKNGADVNARISSYNMTRSETQPPNVGASARRIIVSCTGFTPLHLAALMGNEKLVKMLLDHKADVNARASQERTPLHLAITVASPAVVKTLVDGGADVNAVSSDDRLPPLTAAVKRMSEELVSIILAAKPNLELRDPDGLTALQVAGLYSLGRFEEMLLDAGADPNVVYEKDGQTPLHWAVNHRQKRIVEALLKRNANPSAADSNGRTALDYAKSLAPQIGRRGPRVSEPSRGIPNRGGISPNTSVSETSDIVELLRKAGATEYPQRPNTIMIGRGENFSVVFTKNNQPENRYTLMEAIGVYFRTKLKENVPGPGGTRSQLSFPDFANIRVSHLKTEGNADAEEVSVNLAKAFQTGDCSKDIPLRWGDLIEIPEAEHKLNASWPGLLFEESEPLRGCLRRTVDIRVKTRTSDGQARRILDFFPIRTTELATLQLDQVGGAGSGIVLPVNSFNLEEVLRSSNVLRSTSDLTRVKVSRTDPGTQKANEILVNLFDPAQNLWLRNGDKIEVPEKEQP